MCIFLVWFFFGVAANALGQAILFKSGYWHYHNGISTYTYESTVIGTRCPVLFISKTSFDIYLLPIGRCLLIWVFIFPFWLACAAMPVSLIYLGVLRLRGPLPPRRRVDYADLTGCVQPLVTVTIAGLIVFLVVVTVFPVLFRLGYL